MNVVRSDPLNINRVSELSVNVKGELEDVFDGSERVVAVVGQCSGMSPEADGRRSPLLGVPVALRDGLAPSRC